MRQSAPVPSTIQLAPRVDQDRLTFTGILIGAYLALFLCQFDLCMRLQGRLSFPPLYLLLGSQSLLAVSIWYQNPRRVLQLLGECRGGIFAFAAIAVLAFAGAALPDADLSDGGMNAIYPTLDFLIYLLAIPLVTIFASARNWRLANLIALIGIATSIFIDARYPGTFSLQETRAAGFGINPNRGAAITVMVLIGALDWKHPRISFATVCWGMLALAAVFLTLSRSGVLMLGVVGTSYLRLCVRRNGMGSLVLLGGLAFGVGGYALIAADAAQQVLPMFESAGSRANLFSGQLDAMDTSEDSRLILVQEYFDMIFEHPILGWGTGFTYGNELGAHNMFLARWVDNGIFGLGTYVALIWMTFRTGRKYGSWECMTVGLFVFAYSFFTHNLLEQKNMLLIMAISAGRAALNAPRPVSVGNAVLATRRMAYSPREGLAKAG